MERDGAFQLSSHDGLFIRTEPVKDILTMLGCPIFSSPPFHAFLVVLPPSDTNHCQGALHYVGHLVHMVIWGGCLWALYLLSKDGAQPVPCRKHCQYSYRAGVASKLPSSYFNEQELGFPPMSHPGFLKGSRFASELHSLLMHPADLHLFVEHAKNILKLPGL